MFIIQDNRKIIDKVITGIEKMERADINWRWQS